MNATDSRPRWERAVQAGSSACPQDGDVLVSRETRSHVHYPVRQLPGLVQFSAAGREDAVRLAVAFGHRHAVDVWYGEAGVYRLLESCRPPASTQAPVRPAAGLASRD